MAVQIEDEEVFKSALKHGINLFTGDGFSALPDDNGNKLPLGLEYCRGTEESIQP